MSSVFKLPDLGEGLREAEIVAWHVGEGDRVVTDQPLVSVETDKAVVELPSPHSGYIAHLHGAAGDIIEVGAPLVEFTTDEADAPVASNVVELPEAGSSKPPPSDKRIKAMPAVRRLAHTLGVDLAAVTATGPDGSITKADVEDAAATAASGPHKLHGVRRVMWQNMARAGREVVSATITDEADIDAWPARTDVTVRLIRAMAAGCKASPSLNAWFDSESETLRVHSQIDLGIAVETEEGLFAPVMRDVGNRDREQLRGGLEAMKRDMENRSIPHDALVGATITLSNFGMYGGRFGDLVLIPPQVAILGAGRADIRVVAQDGQPVLHRMVPLSLSFDHRVVTGVEAIRFMNAVVADLTRPN